VSRPPKVETWIRKLFGDDRPLGFQAGDANLYRYAHNEPTNRTDPTGLQSGTRNHSYPLHLGGSGTQPVIELESQQAHVAFHRYFTENGFGRGDAGRAAWARLTFRQQQAHIIRALRRANVPNPVIRENISAILRGANPGVRTPRPSGYPGGIIRLGASAVADVLLNPGIANAAEIDPSWRSLPSQTTGRAEFATRILLIDHPQWWNLRDWNPGLVVRAIEPGANEWQSAGSMTVAEARRLEGTIESREDTPAVAGVDTLGPPRFGYWRERRVEIEVRFTPDRPR
jgi:hypothetical protein